MRVFSDLFQDAGPVPEESFNLPTGDEGLSRDMCPTKVDIMEAASSRDDHSDVVEAVEEALERLGSTPGSTKNGELCFNVSKWAVTSPSWTTCSLKPISRCECVWDLISGGWFCPRRVAQLAQW